MAEGILNVNDGDFEGEVLESSEPTLVDFWAEWCAPCRALGPIVEQVADTYKGRLKVAKMDIDANPATPSRYAVRAVPTLLLFKDGQMVDQVVGLVNKSKLDDIIAKHL